MIFELEEGRNALLKAVELSPALLNGLFVRFYGLKNFSRKRIIRTRFWLSERYEHYDKKAYNAYDT